MKPLEFGRDRIVGSERRVLPQQDFEIAKMDSSPG